MESEQSQNFNDRLSQWVAHQGFWFQIRYSMSSGGSKGNTMFHLLSLSLKLLVFLLIVAAGGWIYLAKRTATERFGETLRADLTSGIAASEIQLGGHTRDQGELAISAVAATGGENTFFTALQAKNVRGKMGFLDGIVGEWDLGTIGISKLDIDLRAGSDDADSSRKLADALFKTSPGILMNSFEVADATLHWGYRKSITSTGDLQATGGTPGQPAFTSDHTRGLIENSLMKVQRQDGTMRLSFEGGSFSQNWLHKLEIVNLVISADRDGMTFETAEFKRGQGTVSFSGLKVVGGARPAIDGVVKVRHLELAAILAPVLRNYVEGTISGEFKVSGSTNETQGILFEGDVVLDQGDVISLRDRLPLLKALTMADYSRKYRRVDFREGSLHFKSGGGGVTLTQVNLKADDLLTLEGAMSVRLPTVEEAKASLSLSGPSGGQALFNGEDSDDSDDSRGEESEFSLGKAALEAKRDKETQAANRSKALGAGPSLFDRLDLSDQTRRMEELAVGQLSRAMRYQGQFRISLLPDAFERAPKLLAEYPVDAKLNRIPLLVPVEGTLFEVTLKMAEAISLEARR